MMRRIFISMLAVVGTVVAFSACSHKSVSEGGLGESANHFRLKKYQEVKLANGLDVLFIEDQTLPRVGLGLMIKSGSSGDPAGQEGLMNLTMSLMAQGTSTRNALKLADDFAQLGSGLDVATAEDSSLMSAATLSQYKGELLQLMADVLMNPAFSEKEMNRRKQQIIANLQDLMDNPTSFADLLLARQIYDGHPYSRISLGTAKSVTALTRTKIIKNYFEKIRPNNAILAVYGQFDNAFKEQVEETFGKWQKGTRKIKEVSAPIEAPKQDLLLVTRQGLQQAQIRFGELGIARNDPDFLKLRLANLILGGGFVSRLNSKVRDELGLTYSISSEFDAKKERGAFVISTFTRNDKVGETIQNTREIFKQFVEHGVTVPELASAKAVLAGQFPMAIETTDRLALNLMMLRLYGVPDSYLTDFLADVGAITVDQVNEVIHKHFSVENLKTVVYADQGKVLKQLKALGPVKVSPASSF
jgi:zinc protease